VNRLWLRLTFAFIAVTLVGVGVIAILVDWSAGNEFRRYLARKEDLTASGLVDELAAFYRRNGNWDGVSNVFASLTGVIGRGRGQGQGQGRGRPPLLLADAGDRVVYDERGTRVGSMFSADERAAAQPILLDGQVVGYLLLNSPGRGALAPAEQAFLDQLRVTLVLAALLAGALGIVLGLFISRTIAAPLSALALSARAFARHDWSRRVKIGGTDEVAAVAREFNAMADELERAEALRRNLIADIAHELRTPLSVLQGNLRALLDEVYPLERSEIATLYDETRLLSRLADDLRELAWAETGQLRLDLQKVNLADALRAAAANFAVAAGAQGVRVDVQVGDDLSARADPDRLAQVLRNFIANALRHTPGGGCITASAERRERMIRVMVSDTGEGIGAEDLPHVFERFYRGDKSRARTRGGAGLGLAIAKALVGAMGGEIGVDSEVGRGSCFWFTLPDIASSPRLSDRPR